MDFISGTQNQINFLENLIIQVLDLPKEPDVVVSKLGRNKNSLFGRTERHAISRKHPVTDVYVIPAKIIRKIFLAYQAGTLPVRIKNRIDSLTNGQRTAIRDAIRDAIVLDDSWKPDNVLVP